ncbi:unnamed protein product [Adineta ricciae]|uniref:O-acyltransferase n=2 Tax=Bdelloidea TaxID=44578 RepID=A0A813YEU1_ADIRI|nr:unnamed protein product [Adineta ricciae]
MTYLFDTKHSIGHHIQSNSMTKDVENEIASDWFNSQIEQIQLNFASALQRVESDMNAQLSSLKNELEIRGPKSPENPPKKTSNREIKESRVYVPRNSILTDLFEISHIQSVRNVFAAILIILVIQGTLHDLINEGRINLDFKIVFECFAHLHISLFIWLIMQLTTAIAVYMGFYLWACQRRSFKQNLKIYDSIWLSAYAVYIMLFLILPCRQIVKHDLAIASALIVLLEQIRQLMKVHSFIRENVPRNLSLIGSDNATFVCPDYSKYLYFLFAPTLIYRDEYPRNATIRWNYVVQMFGQVLASMFYVYCVAVRFCVPTFSNLNRNEITLPIFISVLFNSIMPGSLFLLLGFYGFLHCWLNAFAEMLRFADRMFYKDWWNSTSFANYYRTWNVVVHDWLHTYVYREIYVLIGKKNRAFPSICVVLLSAVFHEYVMMFALGFFYPVMFLLFGVAGLAFLFLLPRHPGVVFNILIWLFLFVGVGLQSCFYFMEAYARRSCPANNTIWDKVVPRSFVCRVSLPSGNLLHIDL